MIVKGRMEMKVQKHGLVEMSSTRRKGECLGLNGGERRLDKSGTGGFCYREGISSGVYLPHEAGRLGQSTIQRMRLTPLKAGM